jgi:hypothetical protein
MIPFFAGFLAYLRSFFHSRQYRFVLKAKAATKNTNNLERQCRSQINRQDTKTPGKYSGILASWCLGDLAIKSLFREGKDLRVGSTNRELNHDAGC